MNDSICLIYVWPLTTPLILFFINYKICMSYLYRHIYRMVWLWSILNLISTNLSTFLSPKWERNEKNEWKITNIETPNKVITTIVFFFWFDFDLIIWILHANPSFSLEMLFLCQFELQIKRVNQLINPHGSWEWKILFSIHFSIGNVYNYPTFNIHLDASSIQRHLQLEQISFFLIIYGSFMRPWQLKLFIYIWFSCFLLRYKNILELELFWFIFIGSSDSSIETCWIFGKYF